MVKVHIFDWSEVYFRDQPHLAAGFHGSHHLNWRNSNALVGFMCCCHFWDQTVSIDPHPRLKLYGSTCKISLRCRFSAWTLSKLVTSQRCLGLRSAKKCSMMPPSLLGDANANFERDFWLKFNTLILHLVVVILANTEWFNDVSSCFFSVAWTPACCLCVAHPNVAQAVRSAAKQHCHRRGGMILWTSRPSEWAMPT